MSPKNIFIGSPCQVRAVRLGQLLLTFVGERFPGKGITWPEVYPEQHALDWIADIAFTVSVFCFGKLLYGGIEAEFRAAGIQLTCKADSHGIIPGGRGKCRGCHDFEGDLADISFGPVGAEDHADGWTTVIARTETGRAVLRSVLADGVFEIAPDRLNLDRLAAARTKRVDASRRLMADSEKRLPPRMYGHPPAMEDVFYDSLLQDFYAIQDLTTQQLCSLCGMCATICPKHSISMDAEEGVYFNGVCNTHICGLCFALCPEQHYLQGIEPDRLVRELMADYFDDKAEITVVRGQRLASAIVQSALVSEGFEAGSTALCIHLLGNGDEA